MELAARMGARRFLATRERVIGPSKASPKS
jgi:hypothetical protein